MSQDNKVDMLIELKKKADMMGVTYNAKIGFDKLKEKIDAHIIADNKSNGVADTTTSIGPNKSIQDIEKRAKEPLLVKIKDLDASQQNDPTIVTNIGNAYFKIGCITEKNKEQLVPRAVVEELKSKTMVEWVDEMHAITKRPTGNKTARTTPRYAIQILDENPTID